MEYKDSVVAVPNKVYTEEGKDISPKYYWDDEPLKDEAGPDKKVKEVVDSLLGSLEEASKVTLEQRQKETVNHPDHYNAGKYETIDIIRDQLTKEEFTGFCLGNAIKYISRCQHKGKMVEDIRKAIWYLNELIEN